MVNPASLVTAHRRRSTVVSAGAAVLAIMSAALSPWDVLRAAPPAPDSRPNIVFFLADDLGYMDIGANNPKTFYRTPRIDSIAAKGMRFTAGYAACQVCSPTRASIMTGKYPPRTGITDYIGGHRAQKLVPAPNQDHLALEEVTLAEALREAGYTNFFAGKWHLGRGQYSPNAQGFGPGLAGQGQFYYPPGTQAVPGAKDDPKTTDRIADEAVRFIEANAGKAFFAYLPFLAVHVPIGARPDLIEKHRQRPAPPELWGQERKSKVRLVQGNPVYAAMLEQLDSAIGRVLDALERQRLSERTIIVFMSDNGGLATAEGHPTSNLPLRGGKGWPYEGGIREPWFVLAPGTTRPGSVCDKPVISTDFYPTLLELAGLPPRPAQHRDGVSLVPLLRGGTLERGPLFWHYPHYGNQGGAPCGAIRDGNWKLIEWYEDNSLELFNLRDDPGEQRNLAALNPDKTKAFRASLAAWRKDIGAIMPTRNPNPDAQPVNAANGKKKTKKTMRTVNPRNTRFLAPRPGPSLGAPSPDFRPEAGRPLRRRHRRLLPRRAKAGKAAGLMRTCRAVLTQALWLGALCRLGASETIWLSDLELSRMHQVLGVRRIATAQRPIFVGGEKFERGVQTRAPSRLWIDLAGESRQFLAQVGVPDVTNNPGGAIEFSLAADGKLLWQSGAIGPGQKPRPVEVDLRGMKHLVLSVNYAGDNFKGNLALWGGARFLTGNRPPVTFEAPAEKAVVLTPKPPPAPRITGARVFGVRPGSPFLFTIPATGERPMRFAARELPAGLKVDEQTGQITGELEKKGTYGVTLEASNRLGVARRPLRIECGDTLALTPHMGWNSWYVWKSEVTDKIVRDAADAMVSSGLINHGYAYVNIDDCWAVRPADTNGPFTGQTRDPQGRISPNSRFPDMKALTDYIHAKGLKAGIYTSPGPLTCARCVGSGQHEAIDMYTFADWGFDFLKHDWCSYGRVARDQSLAELQKPYRLASELLRSQKRDIVLNLCQYGMGEVWKWGKAVGGHSWRTAGDLGGGFYSIAARIEHDVFDRYANGSLDRYGGQGGWNDPDYLLIGSINLRRGEPPVPTPLTPNEQYTHISLWCLVAAPLIFSGDMTRLDEFTLSLLSNDEVIAVDQDPLGKPGRRVARDGPAEVWAKEMKDGSVAVGLFNRSDFDRTVAARWADLGRSGPQRVRDLWRQIDLGDFSGQFQATVQRRGVVLVRIGAER